MTKTDPRGPMLFLDENTAVRLKEATPEKIAQAADYAQARGILTEDEANALRRWRNDWWPPENGE